jgi:hypothetical protein
MRRRTYLATIGGAGVLGVAGVGLARSGRTLSDPETVSKSPRRRSLSFYVDGDELANFGADGGVDGDRIDVSTELWHREGTRVRSLRLRVAMPSPDGDSAASVAVRSPVEGDSSPPPSLTLSSADDRPGTVIELSDFDDLADETISTLGLTVDPPAGATTLTLEVSIGLDDGGLFATEYTLEGTLQLEFSALDGE